MSRVLAKEEVRRAYLKRRIGWLLHLDVCGISSRHMVMGLLGAWTGHCVMEIWTMFDGQYFQKKRHASSLTLRKETPRIVAFGYSNQTEDYF